MQRTRFPRLDRLLLGQQSAQVRVLLDGEPVGFLAATASGHMSRRQLHDLGAHLVHRVSLTMLKPTLGSIEDTSAKRKALPSLIVQPCAPFSIRSPRLIVSPAAFMMRALVSTASRISFFVVMSPL